MATRVTSHSRGRSKAAKCLWTCEQRETDMRLEEDGMRRRTDDNKNHPDKQGQHCHCEQEKAERGCGSSENPQLADTGHEA